MFELIVIALLQLVTLTGTPTDSKPGVNTATQPTTPGSGAEGGFGGWGHDVNGK